MLLKSLWMILIATLTNRCPIPMFVLTDISHYTIRHCSIVRQTSAADIMIVNMWERTVSEPAPLPRGYCNHVGSWDAENA
jgi:hypothetical protein